MRRKGYSALNADFRQTVDLLCTTFIEHVAAERGALKRAKRVQEGYHVSSAGRGPKKRQRTSSEESQRRKNLAVDSMRSRRRSLDNGYISQEENERQNLSAKRFPRRAKQALPSLDEDSLVQSYENVALQRMEMERTQPAMPKSKKPPIVIEDDDDIDVNEEGSEFDDDDLVMSVARPKQRVRDRPLMSDCMSLTPFIMDDDVETDSEDRRKRNERRQLEQMRLRSLLGAGRADQLRSDQNLYASLPARRSSAMHSAGPPGLRLRVDAIIIPVLKGRAMTAKNADQIREGCYTLHKLQSLMRVPRPPPRLYPPRRQERMASGLRNRLSVPQGEAFLSARPPQLNRVREATNETLQMLVRAELERQRDAGDQVRLLPRPKQQQHYTTVRSSLGTWRAEHGGAMRVASSSHPLLQGNSADQVSQPHSSERQNVKITESSMAPVSRNLLLSENVSNEFYPMMLQSRGNHGGYQSATAAPPRPPSMESSLGTLEIPQMSNTVRASQAQLPRWNEQLIANLRSLQSPVTPDSSQLMPQGTLHSSANLNVPERNQTSLDSLSVRRRQERQPLQMGGVQTQSQMSNTLMHLPGDTLQTMNGYQSHMMRNMNATPHQADMIPIQGNRMMTSASQNMMQAHAAPQQYMLGSNGVVNMAARTNAVYPMGVLGGGLGIQQGMPNDVYNRVFQEEYRRMYAERQRQMGGD